MYVLNGLKIKKKPKCNVEQIDTFNVSLNTT